MNLIQISKLAARTVVGMALDGKLGPGHLWTAIKGAEKYLAAAASGDMARSIDAQRRVHKCDECPMATYEGKSGIKAKAIYCGPALDDSTLDYAEPDQRSCGCLVGTVAVTADGRKVYPGAKTMVASESCPQGKWTRVAPSEN